MNKILTLIIVALTSNTLYAVCPTDVTTLNVKFSGVFDATHCKYNDFKGFKCYPIIRFDAPLSYENKSYTELPLNYDNARKHTVVKPYVIRNKTSIINGCGVLGYFDPGVSIDIWELNDN